ncbi:MAG: SAM-dependent methyltransferases [uncultured Thiotrichaceae bacterium]|uniref:SAM-dependent methyltransferases n=1 Tax=uncultured Thiotrichaceae bacterium TaxID=298394 RepID=A0A6S6TVN0_9GAMM|nr:MAG: SAM-dependent methyltransferases [uncultured Thiotrichaceae bacterium]
MTLPLRIRYQTIEFDKTDIHLCTLRDRQQFDDPDGIAHELGISSALWPLFGVIWPSSMVLAHHISNYPTAGKRILEIGCGMALSSLLLNKQNADITATDYHPEVEFFLQRNTHLNNDRDIDFERVNWTDATDTLDHFDLIIGSDLLYEDEHAEQIASFINKHANPGCEIILVDPGRGRKNKLSVQMDKYGYSNSQTKPAHTDYLDEPFKGHILKFWRTTENI